MNCLILVDLQNDFMSGGALAVPHGDSVVPLANALIPHFELVVATQDWHPPHHGSFASCHRNGKVGEVIDLAGLPQVLWPDHCVQKTSGAALSSALNAASVTRVFAKGTEPAIDSYSGFFDNGGEHSTGLGEYLRGQHVTHVFVMGLATDYCVKATALDAVRLGFRTTVVEDACRGVEVHQGDIERAWDEMAAAGIERASSEHWLSERPIDRQTSVDRSTLYEGRFLRLVQSHGWEFAERTNANGVVLIVPVTDQNELLLVEQYRRPVRRRCIELPAGLAGDEPGQDQEHLEEAVRRELLEETGFAAGRSMWLGRCASSAGLTNEMVDFFLAQDLRQESSGGGVAGEQIVVHRIPLAIVDAWLNERVQQGFLIAASLYAGLWLARAQA